MVGRITPERLTARKLSKLKLLRACPSREYSSHCRSCGALCSYEAQFYSRTEHLRQESMFSLARLAAIRRRNFGRIQKGTTSRLNTAMSLTKFSHDLGTRS